jgi:hypothetical protein
MSKTVMNSSLMHQKPKNRSGILTAFSHRIIMVFNKIHGAKVMLEIKKSLLISKKMGPDGCR